MNVSRRLAKYPNARKDGGCLYGDTRSWALMIERQIRIATASIIETGLHGQLEKLASMNSLMTHGDILDSHIEISNHGEGWWVI